MKFGTLRFGFAHLTQLGSSRFLLRRNEGRENMYVFHVTVIYTVDISIEWAFVRTKCFGMSVLLHRKCSPIKLNAFVGAQRTGDEQVTMVVHYILTCSLSRLLHTYKC